MVPFVCRGWKTWLLVAVAAICLVLLFVGGPGSYSQRSHEYAWGLGHILCFAVWSALFLQWRSGWSFARQFVVVIVLTFLLGVGIELAQAGLGRNFDLADVLKNLAGSLLTLAFYASARRSLLRARLLLVQVIAVLVLSAALFPLAGALFDEHLAANQFPVLSDFETSFERNRWEGNARLSIGRDFVSHGSSSLKAELNTDRYSGLFLRFFPEDWREFEMLTFDLYNPSGDELKITCRVHDRIHADSGNAYADRFNRPFSLAPGWTRIDLPLRQIAEAPQGRLLDLEHVAGLGIFVTEQKEPQIIYLDHVRLHR